jgi:hypothetical protein
VEIIGSQTGTYIAPGQPGSMLHITGNSEVPTRIYHDTINEYGSYVFRRYNGSVASPTAVLANQDVARINFTAATTDGLGGVSLAQIRVSALENQTLTAQGSKITFTVTPIGSAATNRVDVATITAADGVSATKFTGPLTGNVTGNVSGNAGTVTNGVYTTDTGTVTNTMLAGSIANNKLSNSSITVNGTAIALGASGTVTAAAGTLTGTTLNSTVVTSSLTSVGTLGSLTVTNLVTARNYVGQARNAGTLGAAGTLTIDFATDHNVLVNLTTTATIAFANITAGKTVTVLVKNATGGNRAVTLGVDAANTSNGNASPNVNNNRTGAIVYRTFGTTLADVYCEFN